MLKERKSGVQKEEPASETIAAHPREMVIVATVLITAGSLFAQHLAACILRI